MSINVVIAGIIAFVLIIFLVKFAAKNLVKILGIGVILIAVAVYIFLVFGNPDKDIKFAEVLTEYTIDDLHNAYCASSDNRADSLKCVCIIQPLYDDIHVRFSEAEISEMKNKRMKFAAELVRAYNNKKAVINQKIKENKADGLFDEFKDDIINRKITKGK